MATGLDSKSLEYIARNLLAGGRLNQLDCIFLISFRKKIFAFIDLEDSPAKLSKCFSFRSNAAFKIHSIHWAAFMLQLSLNHLHAALFDRRSVSK